MERPSTLVRHLLSDEWEKYRLSISGPIKFLAENIKDLDLSGKNLSNCVFSGGSLKNVRLIRCDLSNAVFEHIVMDSVHLLSSNLSNTQFSNVQYRFSNIEKSQFNKCRFYNLNLFTVQIKSCNFNSCIFGENTSFDTVDFDGADFSRCKFYDMSFGMKCVLANSNIWRSELKSVKFNNSTLKVVKFFKSDLLSCNFNEMEIESIDLSWCSIVKMKLQELNLTNTIFNSTYFDNSCEWPKQTGKTSLTGGYKESQYLLKHPVQDVRGLSPVLRRDIADAQYLRELQKNRKFIFNVFFRIWGATTCYGQSISRLSLCVVSIVTMLCILYVLPDFIFDPNPSSWDSACYSILSFFIGFDTSIQSVVNTWQYCLLLIARLFGLVFMGLWIGITANKLGKLSAE